MECELVRPRSRQRVQAQGQGHHAEAQFTLRGETREQADQRLMFMEYFRRSSNTNTTRSMDAAATATAERSQTLENLRREVERAKEEKAAQERKEKLERESREREARKKIKVEIKQAIETTKNELTRNSLHYDVEEAAFERLNKKFEQRLKSRDAYIKSLTDMEEAMSVWKLLRTQWKFQTTNRTARDQEDAEGFRWQDLMMKFRTFTSARQVHRANCLEYDQAADNLRTIILRRAVEQQQAAGTERMRNRTRACHYENENSRRPYAVEIVEVPVAAIMEAEPQLALEAPTAKELEYTCPGTTEKLDPLSFERTNNPGRSESLLIVAVLMVMIIMTMLKLVTLWEMVNIWMFCVAVLRYYLDRSELMRYACRNATELVQSIRTVELRFRYGFHRFVEHVGSGLGRIGLHGNAAIFLVAALNYLVVLILAKRFFGSE